MATSTLRGERGIVVAVNDHYMEYFLGSLAHLRNNIGCTLPIEVWHSGDELSEKAKQALYAFPKIRIRDIATILNVSAQEYRGWHIKPQIIHLSRFDEVILMDADAYFFDNPEKLFDHPGYTLTGAFFFRDRSLFVFRGRNDKYEKKCSFFRGLIPYPSDSLPPDWRRYWEGPHPSEEMPFPYEHQDSGCLAFDKRRHERGLQAIIQLNEDRATTYQYVYGDKETYWMGLEIAGEAYYVNPEVAWTLIDKRPPPKGEKFVDIVQFLEGSLFFQQKHPFIIQGAALLFRNHPYVFRSPTDEECKKFKLAAETDKRYKKIFKK